MILITSAAYVDPQFRNEFGLLPPAFLPIGNNRLFEHQIKNLKQRFPDEKIYLSLPASFEVGQKDLNYFNNENICFIKINENLPLASSVALAISHFDSNCKTLRILHGDTLLDCIPYELDLIAIGDTREDYLWEVENASSSSESVWCGYFAFSDLNLIKECFNNHELNFVEAIKKYSEHHPMRRVLVNSWSDFGHINTYFKSRTKITTERAFNSLTIKEGCVYKSGNDEFKIKAEVSWFQKLPPGLRIYCPQLINFGTNEHGKYFYVLEYLAIPPLNEIFVHGSNPIFYWDKIFKLFFDFLNDCRDLGHQLHKSNPNEFEPHCLNKDRAYTRVEEFYKQNNQFHWNTKLTINGRSIGTINEIFLNCFSLTEKIQSIPGILHGDLCLSNILFDSRSDRIKLIDPRGLDSYGRESNFGDLTYDLAKLTHSIVGLYDYIIAGAYKLEVRLNKDEFSADLNIYIDERVQKIQNLFCSKRFDGLNTPLEVMPLTILLFLSMLPLHSDNPNRQLALLSNAMRLYSIFIMEKEA